MHMGFIFVPFIGLAVLAGFVALIVLVVRAATMSPQTYPQPPMASPPPRETPLDIHHTIAPLTSRVGPNAEALLAASIPLSDPRLRILGPADMVLHSAVHLLNDEVGKPLRDLLDLHDLL